MGPGQRRAALILVAVVSVNASYTVLIPFVPDLEGRVGAGPAVIALTFALFAAAKAVAQPVGGWWVDRWRPGAVAFTSMMLAAAAIVLTALARDSVTLLAGRLVWGVAEGLVSPALYAGMTALCRRYGISTSRMMGNFSSAAIAGFLLGPLVAGLAGGADIGTLFLAGAAVTALTAFGLLHAIPGSGGQAAGGTGTTTAPATTAPATTATATTAPPATTAAPSPAAALPTAATPDTATPDTAAPDTAAPETATPDTAPTPTAATPTTPAATAARWWVLVLVLGALDMFTSLIYTALEPVLPLYLSTGQRASARAAISVVFVVGLAASGVAMWALGRWTERLRLVTLVGAGLAVLATGLAGLSVRATVLPVASWFVVLMVGYAVLFLTARRGIMELRSAAGHQGKAFGLFGAVSDVGNILGPVIGTVLYELTGRLAFVLLGGLSGLLLAALLIAVGRRRAGRAAGSASHPDPAGGPQRPKTAGTPEQPPARAA
jgi:MFS family permease